MKIKVWCIFFLDISKLKYADSRDEQMPSKVIKHSSEASKQIFVNIKLQMLFSVNTELNSLLSINSIWNINGSSNSKD